MYQWFLWLVFVRALPYPSRVDFLSSGKFSDEQLNIIRAHPDVALVTEDGIASIRDTVAQYILIGLRRRIANNVSRTDAFWGTARLGQDQGLAIRTSEEASDYDYNYDQSSGDNVDIYILGKFHAYLMCAVALKGCLDTGVYIDHVRFSLHLVPVSRCLTTN